MIQEYLNKIKNAVYGKDVRQAIHDGIRQCYDDGKAGQLDLIAREGVEEIKANISNPNLLINGDFRINQKGSTKYAPTGNVASYTVDRWFIFPSTNDGSGHSLTVNKGYVTFASTNANMSAFMGQFLEEKLSGTYTITVKVKSASKPLELMYRDGGTIYTAMTLKDGLNTATIECGSLDFIRIDLTESASIDIEYIKLEKGTIATPLVPRPYAEELALCQRHYLNFPSGNLYSCYGYVNVEGTVAVMTLPLPCQLAKVPTVNFDSFSLYGDGKSIDVSAIADVEVFNHFLQLQIHVSGLGVNTALAGRFSGLEIDAN